MTAPQPLKLDQNERSEGAPAWVEAAIGEIPRHLFWRYEDRSPLELSLAQRSGVPLDQVLVTNGGDEGILYMLESLSQDTPVILPRPGFNIYHELADTLPVRQVVIPAAADLSLDDQAIEKALSDHPAGLLVLLRPNNPTGELLARAVVLRILQKAAAQKTLVLLDEAYAEFARDNLVDLLPQFPNLVILRTFSKAWGLAGLRVGWLMGQYVVGLRKRALPFNVSSLSLYFAAKAIEHEQDMVQYAAAVKEGRQALKSWLEARNIRVFDSEANFLLLELGPRRSRFVSNCLLQQGIRVRTFAEPDLSHCLRISVPADITPLQAALELALEPDLICLDVDGCLIDVCGSFDAVVKETVAAYGAGPVSQGEILALRAAGGFNDDIVLSKELLRQRGQDIDLEELTLVFRDFYFGTESREGLHKTETPLISAQLMNRLKTQYNIALVTGRNRQEVALAFPMLGLDPNMVCLTIDDVAKGKPDPQGILTAAAHFQAKRVWMLGDNKDDILAGLNARAVAIGVSRENRPALEAAGAALVLDNINQLEELL